MTKTKSTKRALLMSALALMLCVSMFIGSTFAWFTDSVTSAGNIIKSGKLEVTMEWADGAQAVPAADSTDWTDASTGAIFNHDKWEPGYVEVRHVKIANEGTLALKYQVNILPTGDVSELADAIDVYYADPAVQVPDRAALADDAKIGSLTRVLAAAGTTASGNLEAGASHTITIALKMRESAGNEYQDKEIGSDFAVQLLATQLTSEEDSFDNQYDIFADYDGEISTASALTAALEKGGVYKMIADVDGTAEEYAVAADGTAIDLNDNNLSVNFLTSDGDATIANGTLTLPADGYVYPGTGNVTLENVVIDSDDLSVMSYTGGSVTLKDVTVKNTSTSNPVQNYGGNLVLDNVTVAQAGDANTAWYSSAIQVINEIVKNDAGKWQVISQAHTTIEDGSYSGKKAVMISAPGGNVTINGGTFVGSEYVIQADFAPNNYVDGANFESVITINGGNFTGAFKISKDAKLVIKGGTFSADPSAYVADGYSAVENDDGSYTVVKGTAASTQDALDTAIAAGADKVLLGSGEYTIPATAQGKTMTIVGNGDTAVKVVDSGASEGDIDYSLRGSNVTFENVTLNIQGSNYPGYAGLSATYNNCTIKGSNYTLYGDSVFNECTFDLNNGYVWTWGAANVEFNGCTFEDTTGGAAKAILVHNTTETVVTVKDCTFKGTASKTTWDGIPVAAVSIDPENGSPDATVYFEGTNTVADAYYALYQVKYADEVDDVKVYVDGVEQTLTAMK